MRYTVILTKDEEENVFNASVPALPGCHTWGETEEIAYQNAMEAIKAYVESLKKDNEPIPEEVSTREVTVS